MKMLKQAVMCLSALALVACGGGGGSAGTSPFVTTPPTTATGAASIDVIASALQVPSGGDQVTITATVKNVGNVGLGATAVQFSSDSGALTSAASVTDSSGAATAILTAGANRSNRSITVTVTSGSVSNNIVLPVTGTKLSYSGVTTVALNGAVQSTVTAVDSKGAAIPSLTVTAASSLGNTLSAASLTTDSQGTASIGYTAAKAGSDTLSFVGGGATLATTITISAAQFAFTSPVANTSVPVATKQAVTAQYLSSNVPQSGKTVTFAATAGVITVAGAGGTCTSTTLVSSAVTDSSGNATVCVSSTTASPATIQASLSGVTGVSAQATLPISFVAVTPAKLVLQISPTALGANATGTTTQKATVLATVTDANGNPVSGVIVDFNRCTDPSGGSLSTASATTSSSGQASVQYIAGPTATASNGVLLQASVEGYPAITLPACAANAANATNNTASLTVSQSALFITLGTGNTIIPLDSSTYQKDWVVYVTDANGVAVSNINVTIKVLPVLYGKGRLHFATAWGWTQTPVSTAVKDPATGQPIGQTFEGTGNAPDYVCANEDVNYNGVLDTVIDPSLVPQYTDYSQAPIGEDFDHDGVLEPGNVISVTTGTTTGASSGTLTTGSNGRATISLVYPRSYANWVQVKLVASAVVSGTESSKQQIFWAEGLAADFTTQTISPPGQVSPFGTNSCTTPH